MSLRQQVLTLVLCCLNGSLLPGSASILRLQESFPGSQQEACKTGFPTISNVKFLFSNTQSIVAEARPQASSDRVPGNQTKGAQVQRLFPPCLSSVKPMSRSTTPGSTGRSTFSQSLETTWRAAAGRAACRFAAAAARAKLPPMAALLLMLVSSEELSAADWQRTEAQFWPFCCLACCCWGLAGWNTA